MSRAGHAPGRPLVLVGAALLLAPGTARACAVCGQAADEMRAALLGSTVFLSLLPLVLIFGGAWLLWWYAGKPRLEERPDPVPRPPQSS